jgi:hypothetical protein
VAVSTPLRMESSTSAVVSMVVIWLRSFLTVGAGSW